VTEVKGTGDDDGVDGAVVSPLLSVGSGDPNASKNGGLGLGTIIVSVVGDHVDYGPEAVEWKD
jgi:hypothetical protein